MAFGFVWRFNSGGPVSSCKLHINVPKIITIHESSPINRVAFHLL